MDSLALKLFSQSTMANISVGGKEDPPVPSVANITTDALSIATQAAHSVKNNMVSSKTDKDIQFFVHIEDADDAPPQLAISHNKAPTQD